MDTKFEKRLKDCIGGGANGYNAIDKMFLHIISMDRRLVLSYRVGDGSFVILSESCYFQGKEVKGKKEYLIPFQEPLMIVTPKDVKTLIEWAVKGRNAKELY